MHAEVIESNANILELKLRDEDISVMLIIQHELLSKKDVDFAGVILKHPLIRDYIMRIVTKKEDPAMALKGASANASKYLEELGSSIKTQLKSSRG
ncbi:MAG: RpoL/Rpb11 RNA polymerase subunit family protein [Nitrososphaeraceae archaeon]|jgi:DNA-directed RNA polymerase subunit L